MCIIESFPVDFWGDSLKASRASTRTEFVWGGENFRVP